MCSTYRGATGCILIMRPHGIIQMRATTFIVSISGLELICVLDDTNSASSTMDADVRMVVLNSKNLKT